MSVDEVSSLISGSPSSWQVSLRYTRLLFGSGRLRELGDLVREIGGSRALVVTDPGIREAGHLRTALESLRLAGVGTAIFDGVGENPTTAHVEEGAAVARAEAVDFIVGLGGGSSMDCAKGINFLTTNGGRMEDYQGFNRAPRPMLSSVGVPCTAGTGSEAQSFALIAQEKSHFKMACGDEKVRFKAVILDPLLAETAPLEVVRVAGFDALAHAVESFVTKNGNPLSRLYAREAWSILDSCYPKVVGGSASEGIWGSMLLGAHLAGAAIETSMLGAAHACANPLTASFGVTHGIAVALMLPSVVRANACAVDESYGELLRAVGADGGGEELATRLENLRTLGALPGHLHDLDVDVDVDEIGRLSQQAMQQWTLEHNPRPLPIAEVQALYEAVL